MSNVTYLCTPVSKNYMAANITIEGFIKHFSRKNHFSKNDLFEYYLKSERDIKDGTLRRRIDILKKRGVIQEVSRGLYTMQCKPVWVPYIDSTIKSIYSKIYKKYNGLNFSVWSTASLNEFMNMQAFRYIIIIAVEKDITLSVFENLSDSGLKKIYLQPSKKEATCYFYTANLSYVVLSLLSKSPLQLVNNIKIPKLEKILVDIFCDKNIFFAFQDSEMKNIFRNAFKSYAINISTLLNYSRRRGREKELMEFIHNKAGIKLPTT